MTKPTIIVTGGAGYVGSHAAKALAKAGYLPVVVDNLSRGRRAFVRWGPIAAGDLRDAAFLAAAFEAWRPVAVMHFAALAYVGESVEDPAPYYATNVTGTLNLLEACAAHGVDQIVFSSSCAVYGVPDSLPVREDAPRSPISPYGRSKAMAEDILSSCAEAYGLRVVSLRYFNAAGADPEGELWEAHDPETHLIPLALRAALGLGPPLRVFGTDYPTEDGTCIRDYVHVDDLAQAHLAALRYLEAGGASAFVNLGAGSGHSIRQVLGMIKAVTGCAVPTRIVPRRPGDPSALVADRGYAGALLGWEPRHSDLRTIIRTAALNLDAPLGAVCPGVDATLGKR